MTQTNLTITYRNKGYPVDLNEYGEFTATVQGNALKATSMSQLRELAARVPRKVVDVKFMQPVRGLTGPSGNRLPTVFIGHLTGYHVNGSMLVRWDHKKGADQRSPHGNGLGLVVSYDGMSEEDTGEMMRLMLAEFHAGEAVQAFLEKHRFDARAAMDKALEEAPDE